MTGRRLPRMILAGLGWAGGLGGALMITLGLLPELQLRHRWLTEAASFTPYGVLGWALACWALIAARNRWVKLASVVTVAALLLQVAWTRPYWPRPAPVSTTNLVVMAINTYYGWADADDVLAAVDRYHPDIVVLSEATEATAQLLADPRWRQGLPYSVGSPAPDWDATGLMVFAKTPLTPLPDDEPDGRYRVLRTESASGPLTVIAVHTRNPVGAFADWQADLRDVATAATAHLDSPLVVLGDFNAVREHQPMRALLSSGLTDAAEQAGAGMLPTYPAGAWLPPPIRIDQILIGGGLQAGWMDSLDIDRTDHRGLVAGLAVP